MIDLYVGFEWYNFIFEEVIVLKHEITTYHTKKTMAESLKNAMKNKPFSKITVSEIVKDCGLNRKTFYYHFQDIYDLLKWTLEEEAIEIVKEFNLVVDYEKAIYFVIDYVEENDYLISCAYDSIGLVQMKRFFYNDLKEIISYTIDKAETTLDTKIKPDFKEFVSKFYTEALAGMLIEWVLDKDNRDKDKTVQYMTILIRSGLENMKNMEQMDPELLDRKW